MSSAYRHQNSNHKLDCAAALDTRVNDFVASSKIKAVSLASELSVDLVTTAEGLQALQTDYDDLLAVSHNKLPFALHEWHITWCKHFLEAGRNVTTQRMFHVVRDAERRCVGIVPLILTRRALGPLKIRSLDLVGTDPAFTEIRSSLIKPGYETRVAWAVQRRLAAVRSIDWVRWSGISGTFGDALAVSAKLTWQSPLLDYVLDLPPSWDALRANLKRNIRESIRHCYNSLKRDGISFEMRIAAAPAEVDAALSRFFELHALRANLTGTVAHPNVFCTARSREFLRDVCGRLAARNMVRVFQLVIGGEVVATRVGFVVQDSLYMYYSGYDGRWSDYGVMTTTLVEAIKHAIGLGLASVNFSTGNDVSKTRWGVREVKYARAVEIRASHLSRFAWGAFQRATQDSSRHSWLGRLSRRVARDWR